MFSQKATLYMFDWILNTLLNEKLRKEDFELSKQRVRLFLAQHNANNFTMLICRKVSVSDKSSLPFSPFVYYL